MRHSRKGTFDSVAHMSTTDICRVCWCQVRVGFHGGEDLWVEDVLNIGVDPRYAECAHILV